MGIKEESRKGMRQEQTGEHIMDQAHRGHGSLRDKQTYEKTCYWKRIQTDAHKLNGKKQRDTDRSFIMRLQNRRKLPNRHNNLLDNCFVLTTKGQTIF